MTSDDDIYTPISCGDYSSYELAIMHRQRLHLAWKDTDNNHNIDTLLPLDLQTRQGEEFLIAKTSKGDKLRIRLDHIVNCKAI